MPLADQAKKLYHSIKKTSSLFKDPNFKAYFSRTATEDFRSAVPTEEFLKTQEANLEVLRRQVKIQNMYYSEDFSTKR